MLCCDVTMGTLLALMLAGSLPDLAQLNRLIARFAPTELKVDLSGLSAGDRKALVKLIEAAHIYNEIFLRQLWSGNPALYAKLQQDTTPLGEPACIISGSTRDPGPTSTTTPRSCPACPPANRWARTSIPKT